jgi:hypothetical protein
MCDDTRCRTSRCDPTKAYSLSNIDLTTRPAWHHMNNISHTMHLIAATDVTLPLNTLSFRSRQTHQETPLMTSESNTLCWDLVICFCTHSHQVVMESAAIGTWSTQPQQVRVVCKTFRANEHPNNRYSMSSGCWLHRPQSMES